LKIVDVAMMPTSSKPSSLSFKLGPLFLACPKCGARFHMEHQASKPMILRSASLLKDAEPSFVDAMKLLPMVFSDTGTYIGKVLRVEDGSKLKVVRADVEESCPASRFVFFSSRAVAASEPMTLLMMPEWFEDLPQLSDRVDHYEASILPLLTLLSNKKISEASFLMLLRRHAERFAQTDLKEARFLREASESEIAKIGVALETLEAQKILGERGDEEFLLKKSMLSQIKTYLELVVAGINEAVKRTAELSRKIKQLADQGSISPTTVSEALAVAQPFMMADQLRMSG